MLINKGFSEGDIITIKIINGDEIITRFESEDADTVTITKPLALTMGDQGLGMIPWIFLGDRYTFTIKKEHILIMVPSKKDAATQYMQGTTGIALS